MRDSEFKVIYDDYAFADDMPMKERKMCMDTIFRIQNDYIQDGGRHMEMPRAWMEYCCEMFAIQDDVQLIPIKAVKNEVAGKQWYAKCPFCHSTLIISDSGMFVHKLIGKPRDWARANRSHDEEVIIWKELNRKKTLCVQ